MLFICMHVCMYSFCRSRMYYTIIIFIIIKDADQFDNHGFAFVPLPTDVALFPPLSLDLESSGLARHFKSTFVSLMSSDKAWA